MNKISQFFQEDNGNFSATRLAFLAWIFGVLLIWCNISIQNKKMEEIPEGIQVLIGVLMTGKVAQKFREEQSAPSSSGEETLVVRQSRVLNGNSTDLVSSELASKVTAQDV